MVASAVRDKYGQSKATTTRAEEASEIMKRMEKSDETLSSLTVIMQEWKKKVLFVAHQVAVNDTHGLQRLVHVPVSLLSALQLSLSLCCRIDLIWEFKQSKEVPNFLSTWNLLLDE